LNYLRTILKSDLPSLVDGIAWHMNSGFSQEYQPDYYRNYPRWVKEILSTARAKGFVGQFFALELQWRTMKTVQPITPRWVYSDISVGKYYLRGVVRHYAQDFLITVGYPDYETIPYAVSAISSLTNLLAGTEPVDIQVKFTKPAVELQTVAFRLPDGSQLVAVWRDVVARDDDTGITNTILFPGAKAGSLTGIDPLYAFQQGLVFSQSQDGIKVENFLIQDYPIFIRLNIP
jgi:hypothetical protein